MYITTSIIHTITSSSLSLVYSNENISSPLPPPISSETSPSAPSSSTTSSSSTRLALDRRRVRWMHNHKTCNALLLYSITYLTLEFTDAHARTLRIVHASLPLASSSTSRGPNSDARPKQLVLLLLHPITTAHARPLRPALG